MRENEEDARPMRLPRKVCVIGVGMTRFYKPGEKDYPELALDAGQQALGDAGVSFDSIQQAFVGYVYGESTSGQRAVYPLGLTGIPIVNVNNNCSTGATALFLAWQAVGSGASECVLALGFEKMEKGSLGMKWDDRTMPLDQHFVKMNELQDMEAAPPAALFFGGAGREHMQKYGTTAKQFAKISVKNRAHAKENLRCQFREPITIEEVLASKPITGPLTKLQCCPTTDGAAAAIVCSEAFARKLGGKPVYIDAMAMSTDLPSTFADRSMLKIIGGDMTRKASREVYEHAGVGPEEFQVVELHDCFTVNELVTYEGLGLCKDGEGGRLVDEDAVTYGGKWVVNPSGGLLSKGHPLGATGLAQCFELTNQLRGNVGARQVPGARRALQHNLGLGGACVVAAYSV